MVNNEGNWHSPSNLTRHSTSREGRILEILCGTGQLQAYLENVHAGAKNKIG